MRIITTVLCSLLLASCSNGQQIMNQSFTKHFQPMTVGDTLFFSMDSPSNLKASKIAFTEFELNVDSTQRSIIDYLLDPEATSIVGLGRFSLSDTYDAYLIGVTLSWQGNQSLLIVNKKLRYITALIPVSQFYGGDGGQVLRNSWLFDYDHNGSKDLVIRDSAHSIHMDEEGEAHESYEEYVSLYFWEPTGFKPQVVKDSTALIQRFPVSWDW